MRRADEDLPPQDKPIEQLNHEVFVQQWEEENKCKTGQGGNQKTQANSSMKSPFVYDQIEFEIEDGQGERCFLIYGKEGRGKTTIAEFIADRFASQDINRRVLSGTQVTMSVVDEWKMDTMYVQSDNVVVVINEVDRVHKNVQDHMHDWLQKLPRNWVFIVTTNHKPCVRAEYEKLTAEQRAEHLTPKFSSRFMHFEAPDIGRKELGKVIYNRCLTRNR